MHVIAGLGAGGAETQLVNLVTAERPAAPESIVVNLLAQEASGLAARLAEEGIEVHNLGLSGFLSLFRTQRRLAGLIRAHQPDVVQSWMYYADILSLSAMRKSGRIGKTSYFWNVRCSDMDFSRYRSRLRRTVRMCAWRSKVPDGVVVNSLAGRQAHADIGYRPKAWHLIDNGIDTDRFMPGDKEALRRQLGLSPGPIAIHIARVDPMKDHETLRSAAAACPDWTFVAVGEGTQSLSGPPNLVRLGRRNDVGQIAPAGDVILSTSAFGEGFSNALAEGMACGLVPVATDVGDSSRLVGEVGWIVPPRRPDAVVNVLRAVVGMSAQERQSRSAAARQRIIEEFSVDLMVDRFDRLHSTGQVA